MSVAALYAIIGIRGWSLYSNAKTVAAANATVVWPDGKELFIVFPVEAFEKGPKNFGSASVVEYKTKVLFFR